METKVYVNHKLNFDEIATQELWKLTFVEIFEFLSKFQFLNLKISDNKVFNRKNLKNYSFILHLFNI